MKKKEEKIMLKIMLNEYLQQLQEAKSEISYRDLDEKDLETLKPLFKRFIVNTNNKSYFKYKDETFENWTKSIREAKNKILVAYVNNKPVGMVIGLTKLKPLGSVKAVYLDKPYRGTGVASYMFKEVIS